MFGGQVLSTEAILCRYGRASCWPRSGLLLDHASARAGVVNRKPGHGAMPVMMCGPAASKIVKPESGFVRGHSGSTSGASVQCRALLQAWEA